MADGDLPTSEKVIGWCVVLFILLPITLMVLDKHADTVRMIFLFLIVLALIALGGVFLYPLFQKELDRRESEQEFAVAVAEVEAELAIKRKELKRLYDLASRPLADPRLVAESWRIEFRDIMENYGYPWNPEFHRLLFHVAFHALDQPRTFRPYGPLKDNLNLEQTNEAIEELRPLAEQAEGFDYVAITNALSFSILAFLKALPPPHNNHQPFFPTPAYKLVDVGRTIVEVLKPFSDNILKEDGMCGKIREKYGQGFGVAGVWPMQYKGDDILDLYLTEPFKELFLAPVPFQPFSELNRCAHHWCLGKPGRGKTTFLRHLIQHDLTEVAKGNCSLVVIDGKPQGLVHEMRTLKQFGPNGDLHNRLIVIDSDKAFPLNPFKITNPNLASSLVSYMIATDTSDLQTGALTHFIDAVLASEDKSLETLLRYIRMGDKEQPRAEDFRNFDDELKTWWTETRPGLYGRTASGVEERLANFMRMHKGAPILRNLRADSWGLDLYKELNDGGKVLLVDTDTLKNDVVGAALMGRLFIALIENLASRRQKAPKPIWIIIDEATDYLAQKDPRFVQILIKARAAKVGVTVAYQTRGLIDPTIEKTLEIAEIQSRCEQRGRIELTVEERPLTIPVSELEFDRKDQMGREHYTAMRERMAHDYPYQTPKQKPKAETFDPTAEAE